MDFSEGFFWNGHPVVFILVSVKAGEDHTARSFLAEYILALDTSSV